jgi:hypothetical protein
MPATLSLRIAFNIALPLIMLFLPWWLFVFVLLAAFLMVGRFFEGVLWALAADIIHGSSWGFHGSSHAFLIGSVVAFILISFVRERLSWQR